MNNNRQGERFGNDGESTNAKNLKAERESLGTGTTRTSSRLNILIKLKSTQTSPREERTSAYVALREKNVSEEFKAAAQKDTAKRCTRLTGNP